MRSARRPGLGSVATGSAWRRCACCCSSRSLSAAAPLAGGRRAALRSRPLRAHRQRPHRHAATARAGLPARHRRPRPRRADATAVRRTRVAAGRLRRGAGRAGARRAARACWPPTSAAGSTTWSTRVVQVVLNVPLLFVLIVLSIFLTPNTLAARGDLRLLLLARHGAPGARHRAVGAAARLRRRGARARRLAMVASCSATSRPNVVVGDAGGGRRRHGRAPSWPSRASAFWASACRCRCRAGATCSACRRTCFASAPWLVYPPGLMIFVTVLSVFLVSDGLRDALDPRTRTLRP